MATGGAHSSLEASAPPFALGSSTIDQALRAQVAKSPDRRFLSDDHQSLTFREVAALVARLAAGLASNGVVQGDRVALMLPNSVEFVLWWMACSRLGATSVFVNPSYMGTMLNYVMADARARALIVHGEVHGQLTSVDSEILQALRFVCAVGEREFMPVPAIKYLTPRQFLDASPISDEADADPLTTNCVIYTSGTTGPSKGVVLTTSAVLAGSRTFVELMGLTPADVLFSPMPLFHGLASRQGVLGCLLVGSEIVIGRRFSASRFWDQAIACRGTMALTMFNIPAMLKAQPHRANDRLHRLRAMYNAGHDEEFERRYGVELVEAYGLVETGITIYAPANERQPGSCGKLHRDWEARIVDHSGDEVPDGQVGELLLRPRRPGLFMTGYLNKPEATLHACRDFWFHTGDFLSRDEGGRFYFAGRQKERIRRRGENISGWEIEKVVAQHPSVQLCAAMGHPAEVGDDDVRLVITLMDGQVLRPDELASWLADRLPAFMLPRYIEILPELPLTSTEKIRKDELIEQGLSADAWDAAAHRLTRD